MARVDGHPLSRLGRRSTGPISTYQSLPAATTHARHRSGLHAEKQLGLRSRLLSWSGELVRHDSVRPSYRDKTGMGRMQDGTIDPRWHALRYLILRQPTKVAISSSARLVQLSRLTGWCQALLTRKCRLLGRQQAVRSDARGVANGGSALLCPLLRLLPRRSSVEPVR